MEKIEDLFKLDIRIGTVIKAITFPEASKPTSKTGDNLMINHIGYLC